MIPADDDSHRNGRDFVGVCIAANCVMCHIIFRVKYSLIKNSANADDSIHDEASEDFPKHFMSGRAQRSMPWVHGPTKTGNVRDLKYPESFVEKRVSELSLKDKIHALFEPSSLAQEFFADRHRHSVTALSIFSVLMILVSVIVFTVESIPRYYNRDLLFFFTVETCCIAWFTFELSIRFITCNERKVFFKDLLNLVDIIAIFPYYIDLVVIVTGGSPANSGLVILRVVRLTRVFRVFKLSKYNEGIQVVGAALKNSTDALSLLLFLTTITVVLFGSGIFYAEQGAAYFHETNRTWVRKDGFGGPLVKHHFQSIPDSFWWCLVTVTTVGYGDMYPVTFPGYLVGAAAMLTGLLIVAFPIIILGANFSEAREALARKKDEEYHKKMALISSCEETSEEAKSAASEENTSSEEKCEVTEEADVVHNTDTLILQQLLRRLDGIEFYMRKQHTQKLRRKSSASQTDMSGKNPLVSCLPPLCPISKREASD